MSAQAQGLAVADGQSLCISEIEELVHHHEGFFVGYDRDIRIGLDKVFDVGGVIRLHVLDDQVIGLASVKDGSEIVQPLMLEVDVDRVHDGDLLIVDHVGIVGHSVGDRVLALKQIHLVVVDTDVFDVFCNLHRKCSFLIRIRRIRNIAVCAQGAFPDIRSLYQPGRAKTTNLCKVLTKS